MERDLSIFFNIDRTYVTVVEPSKTGLKLLYVNATKLPINMDFLDDSDVRLAMEELEAILENITVDVSRLHIIMAAENVLISQFPGKAGISNQELQKLVSFEIRQRYPQFSYEDFAPSVVPLSPRKDGKQNMMSVIIAKQDLQFFNEITRHIGLDISSIEISQLAAHTAFMYNYPEKADKTIAMFGIQSQFVDVSVMVAGKPLYYNLITLNSKDEIGQLIQDESARLLKDYVDQIHAIYYFGAGLNKDLFIAAWEASMLLNIESGRLNGFRMMTTDLDERDRQYCGRVGHIIAPCIGGSLIPSHELIRLS